MSPWLVTPVGGMAAHFDFSGTSIEPFYHFVCKSDAPTFALMKELGIADRMRWVNTCMAYYTRGKVHKWGDPISLLRYPHLTLTEKFRTGLQMFLTTKSGNFDRIEHLTSRQWIERIADLETSLNAKLEIGNRQLAIYYLFENWKRLRAPFCPYFLRSLMRGSRVINPACFSAGLKSPLYSIRARVIP